jgi:hypothetical protein
MKRRGNVISPIDSINTVVEMLQQTDSSVEDGEIVWVRSEQTLFVYRVNSGLIPDGATVVASLYGNGGVWQRITFGVSFLGQNAWFVDPTNGNDASSGKTSATAIRTLAELARRWGIVTNINVPTTVTILGSVSATDPLNLEVRLYPGGKLTFVGTTTVVASGTFTAVTAINRGTQTPMSVQDGAVNWAPHVGRQLFIPSGANVNGVAFIAKNVGGGVARVSPFVQNPTTFAAPTLFTPGLDPYQVRTLPDLPVGTLRFEQASAIFDANAIVLFQDLHVFGQFGFNGIVTSSGLLDIAFNACHVESFTNSSPGFQTNGCRCSNMSNIANGAFFVVAGLITGGWLVAYNSIGFLDGDVLAQASKLVVVQDGVGVIGTACAFDNPSGPAVQINSGAKARSLPVTYGVDLLWGTANSGYGMRLFSEGAFAYITKPTINAGLGAGREVLVGGTDKLWAAVPFNDSGAAASGAIVAVIA